MPPQNLPEVTAEEQQIVAVKEEEKKESENSVDVIVPPDGGWAWVVMVASFLCNTIVDGIVFSSGLIQEDIQKEFGVSKGYVALVSSLLSGFYLIAGPFVSALTNKFGFRPVTIAGSIIASIAFGLSYFANSVEYLFLTYGIIGGVGFCLIYIPSVISIGYYFEKWRAVATGIALCGSGVGTFIFAPLTEYCVKQTNWRVNLAIQAGIILICGICGCAYRPIQPIKLAVVNNETDDNDNEAKKLKEEIAANHKAKLSTRPAKPLPEGRFAYSVPTSAHNTYSGTAANHQYPTAAEVFRGLNLERRPSSTSKGTELKYLRKSQPTTPHNEPAQNFNLNKELTTVGENEEEHENLLSTETKAIVVSSGRRHTVSGRRPGDAAVSSKSSTNLKVTERTETRPMYRDDVFFTGSLVKLPQYTSQTSLGYHLSVTRLPTKADLDEQRSKSGCKLFPEAVKRTLKTMLDVELLKSPSFMLLCTSGFLTMMGFFVPFVFIKDRATEGGMDQDTATLIVSAIGGINTIARIICGALSTVKGISPLLLNNIAITAGGIATIVLGMLSVSNASQFTYAFFFGICIACFSALRSLIAVELMGLEKLTNAFGFLMLGQGLAAAIGAPIAGVFYENSGYDAAFYFAGTLITISALLCYPLNYVNAWEKKRQETKNHNGIKA